MKGKRVKVVLDLTQLQGSKMTSQNSSLYLNALPQAQTVDLEASALDYANNEMENAYGIDMAISDEESATLFQEQILGELRKLKSKLSFKLANSIQRLDQQMNYGELQETKEILQTLNKKQVSELGLHLGILHDVVNTKLSEEGDFFEAHTVIAAKELIEELKKVNKMSEVL